MAKEWVMRGWFLDLEEIDPEFRPDENYRFFYVKRQRLTAIEDLSVSVEPLKETTLDLAEIGTKKEILDPESKSMIFQCAYGIYPDVKAYLEHPVDYSVGKIPKERPSDNYRVGIITQRDSPYDNPNLDATEFWIIKGLAHKPRIHIYNPHDITVTAYVKILVNKLIVEPVTDREVINQLERRIKPSTPVYLKVSLK